MTFHAAHLTTLISTVLAVVVVIAEFCFLCIPYWQRIDIVQSKDYLQVGLWTVCIVKPGDTHEANKDCYPFADFNKIYVNMQRELYSNASNTANGNSSLPEATTAPVTSAPVPFEQQIKKGDLPLGPPKLARNQPGCNRTLVLAKFYEVALGESAPVNRCAPPPGGKPPRPWFRPRKDLEPEPEPEDDQCHPKFAPLVTGAVFYNDTLFDHVRIHYTCVKGYRLEARYSNDVFCVCHRTNSSNCTWTKPPVCVPDDTTCLVDGVNSDVCTVGSRNLVIGEAIGLVNKDVGLHIPEASFETATYIFEELRFTCNGDIRHWDIVAWTPGTIFVDIWRENKTDGLLYLVDYQKFHLPNIGLNGIILKPEQRMAILKGDLVGIHYEEVSTNHSVIFARNETDHSTIFKATMNHSELLANFTKMDRSEMTRLTSGYFFYPAIIGYVTVGESVPVKYSVVQALPIISTISSVGALIFLILVLVHLYKYLKTVKAAKPGEGEVREEACEELFAKSSRYYQFATMCTLLAGISLVNCFALFYQSYNCNQFYQWTMGPMGFVLMITGFVATCLVVLICVAEKKMILFISSHPHYTAIIAALPAAGVLSDRRFRFRTHSDVSRISRLSRVSKPPTEKQMPQQHLEPEPSTGNLKAQLLQDEAKETK